MYYFARLVGRKDLMMHPIERTEIHLGSVGLENNSRIPEKLWMDIDFQRELEDAGFDVLEVSKHTSQQGCKPPLTVPAFRVLLPYRWKVVSVPNDPHHYYLKDDAGFWR